MYRPSFGGLTPLGRVLMVAGASVDRPALVHMVVRLWGIIQPTGYAPLTAL